MTSTSKFRRACSAVSIVAALLCLVPAASAQSNRSGDPKWTFELLGGYALEPIAQSGTSTLDFPGAPFTTEGGFPSRTVPSWYFGSGAQLFNDVAAQFASRYNVQIPSIDPLDDALGSGGRAERAGIAFGARITRRILPRLSFEVEFQRRTADVAFGSADAIEASRASFEAGFKALLSTIPQAGLQVSSTANIPGDVSATRNVITGAFNIGLVQGDRFGMHLTLGGGRVTADGGVFEARLAGNYQFRFFDINPINETDNVTIRFEDQPDEWIGVAGVGFTIATGRRQGLRADIRAHAGQTTQTTTVTATPSVQKTGSPLALPSITTPSIQFSNTTTRQSSLSETASDVRTFSAEGTEVRPVFTVSYYFRF